MLSEGTPPHSAAGRRLYARFIEMAQRSPDLFSGLRSLIAPDGRVHVQNGDTVSVAAAERHALMGRTIFPDMQVMFDDTFFVDDVIVIQLRVEATVGPGIPMFPAGMPVVSLGCFVARANEEGLIAEAWSHVNPGFTFSYPRTGVSVPEPVPDGAGEDHARTLYSEWLRRANAGMDFVHAVSGTVAADGAVHIGNGDTGRGDALEAIFARIAVGLPDVSLQIDEVMFSDDRVLVLFTMSGTHMGPIGIWPASGRTLPSTGALIARANRSCQASQLWIYLAPGYSITLPPARGG